MLERVFKVHRSEEDDMLNRKFYGEPVGGFIQTFKKKEQASKKTVPAVVSRPEPIQTLPEVIPKQTAQKKKKTQAQEIGISKQTIKELRLLEFEMAQMDELRKYNKNHNSKQMKRKKEDIARLRQEFSYFDKKQQKQKSKKQDIDSGSLSDDQQPQKESSSSEEEIKPTKPIVVAKKTEKEAPKGQQPYENNKKNNNAFCYTKYLSVEEIEASRSRKQNKYYLGNVVVNERCKWMARLICKQLDGKFTAERDNMNRAIHDSLVYFEILPSKQEQKSSYTEEELVSEQDKVEKAVASPKNFKCRVVAIKQHAFSNKPVIGKLLVRKRHGKDQYLFEPIDDKLPKFEVSKCAYNMRQHRQQIQTRYFTARFSSWTENQQYPYVDVVGLFGEIGDIETECKALLTMNGVYQDDFSQATMDYLKDTFTTAHLSEQGEYIIPKEEIQKRHDLRKELIFTIDPKTARDFDDALSVKRIPKSQFANLGITSSSEEVFQVGIHIADVSYFVPENSPIDQDARLRTTSVYLVHRVIPMLPRILCETMCSLNPGVDRLIVSVWCYLQADGTVLQKVKFGRSVMHSQARLTYETAQKMITGTFNPDEPLPSNEKILADKAKVVQAVLLMDKLAKGVKEKRLKNGSITLEGIKKKFELDKRFWPTSYSLQERFDANFLVEEFMLLGNIKVAEILASQIREVAVLRRHRFPNDRKIQAFESFLSQLGVNITVSKDTPIMEQIKAALLDEEISANTKKLIRYQLVYLLEAAEYFMVGQEEEDEWLHYALGFACYTHFTSPIRRYPDVLVHRQLIKVMQSGKDALQLIDKEHVSEVLKKSNQCKMAARRVSSGCEKIFMCLYLKNNQVFTSGIVTGLNKDAVQITIPQYDIKSLINLSKCSEIKEIQIIKSTDSRRCLKLKFQSAKKGVSLKFVLRETQMVKVWLGSTDTFPIDYLLKLALPNLKSPSELLRVD